MTTTTPTNFTGQPQPDPAPRPARRLSFAMFTQDELQKSAGKTGGIDELTKSAINTIDAIRRGDEVIQLAFKEDPTNSQFSGIWKPKVGLVPDNMIKALARTDDLVATILATRSNQLAAFGRELQDRFSTGFRIEPKPGALDSLTPQLKEQLTKRIEAVSTLMGTCGHQEGFPMDRQMSLSTFLYVSARNAVTFGRFATEIMWQPGTNGEKKFLAFRPVDAGTIYYAHPRKDQQDKQVRERALQQLQALYGERLKKDNVEADKYAYYQVINGRPVQGFTSDELYVWNMYPCTDIELGGYPVTPVDTAISAITTHLNITTHNKLFFQNGRAARGMIIIQSDDVDDSYLEVIRQHFQATATGVEKSWRVPVFGIGQEDKMQWIPMELQGGRDMEFQYLSDQNARVIMSAWQISPEELPGYQHLARGTNNMALSESNNEYKLEAARDVGIRPLLAQFQDFLNGRIMPLIDPVVAKYCTFKLYGLDADTPEREATRIGEDMPLHMTTDEVLERVEKDPLGKKWGGEFLLNPSWQAIVKNYLTVGEILEHFFDREGASKDPSLQYIESPFWFQYQQMMLQLQQAAQQPQGPPPGSAPPSQDGGGDGGGEAPQGANEGGQNEDPTAGSSVAQGADAAMQGMQKSERQLDVNQRRILVQHTKAIDNVMSTWKRQSKDILVAARRARISKGS